MFSAFLEAGCLHCEEPGVLHALPAVENFSRQKYNYVQTVSRPELTSSYGVR